MAAQISAAMCSLGRGVTEIRENDRQQGQKEIYHGHGISQYNLRIGKPKICWNISRFGLEIHSLNFAVMKNRTVP